MKVRYLKSHLKFIAYFASISSSRAVKILQAMTNRITHSQQHAARAINKGEEDEMIRGEDTVSDSRQPFWPDEQVLA